MNYNDWEASVPTVLTSDPLWRQKVYRVLFYEYALGSARESRDWYYKSRFVLGEKVVTRRLRLLSEIIRMLLVIVPKERGHRTIRTTNYALLPP